MVLGFIKKQFIEVIEWPGQDDETIAWRFPVIDNEIKNGAQLTVREGQIAVFLNEGQIADVFKPGRYSLATQNLPLLSSLGAWKHGFNSPFKADIIFINARELRNFKWGTPQPIVIRDQDFGLVRVRAFGSFGVRVVSGRDFIRECSGIRDVYLKDDIEETIRKVVISKFTDALAEMKVGVIDIATRYDELGAEVTNKISKTFDSYGIELSNLVIENVNLPEEIQKAIDEQSKMNLMMSNPEKFAKWQVLQGTPSAMQGSGGGMTHMMADVATGMAVGKMVSETISNTMNNTLNKNSVAPEAVATPSASGNKSADLKFCQDCGAKNQKGAKFCQDCGFKFSL